ncbi:MAG: ATP-dependent helicase HrpB [Terriglobia bacterium]|nr:ATP-dependent helicase HrpB [Terriglobia bacterium]
MGSVNRRPPLPIDEIIPEVLASLARNPNLVIEAAPGAGKTTRVPPALLGAVAGEVIVLEPRRIAARLAARRVASELGEKLGETVGYQVRFEGLAGPQTRLRFVTEGILTRRLLSDPSLNGVSVVVLDEFHERHLETDLALALLSRLQRSRPELRIVVMSATLDAAPIEAYLNCPTLQVQGRQFDLKIEHQPYTPEPLEVQVRNAVEKLCREDGSGDILTFLPGVAEIRRAIRECVSVTRKYGLLALPLHGGLSPAEQDAAVSPSSQRKLILSTNVAESSVTLEGITAVIDSGLARMASYSPWSGLPTLTVARVSKASAKQRAGRAGRTGPGRVLRLYSEEDFSRRVGHDQPEIVRADLSQLCLDLRAMGISDISELFWLDAPPVASVTAAETLLDRLGARGAMANRLAQFPLPPRLARILVESLDRGIGEDGCVAAATLGSGVRFAKTDLHGTMEDRHDPRTKQHIEQLRRIARPPKQKRHNDDALLISVLTGFPDRVARRRAGNQVLLSNGKSAEVAGEPPAYEFMVALDAEERSDKTLPLIRMTARIEPEWLVDLFPDSVREQSGVNWNHKTERVDAVSELLYDELVIEESRGATPDPDAAADLLAQKALEAGLERFIDLDALEQVRARAMFAGLQPADGADVLRELSSGLRSFTELRKAAEGFIPLLEQKVGRHKLEKLAPATVRLPNGRQTKIHYEPGKPPWVASRLQDFFGMRETPRIGPNSTPLTVHLLAPNHRAVQTTTDLAGFFERLYPQVRRELMRRYPKHAWPERP